MVVVAAVVVHMVVVVVGERAFLSVQIAMTLSGME